KGKGRMTQVAVMLTKEHMAKQKERKKTKQAKENDISSSEIQMVHPSQHRPPAYVYEVLPPARNTVRSTDSADAVDQIRTGNPQYQRQTLYRSDGTPVSVQEIQLLPRIRNPLYSSDPQLFQEREYAPVSQFEQFEQFGQFGQFGQF